LRNYGVPYATGFAYGLALQALEMACGVGLGLIALMREGISFAVLRRMQDDEQSSENVVEEVEEMVEELEQEAAPEGAPVSR
jgi:urease gamma subunit